MNVRQLVRHVLQRQRPDILAAHLYRFLQVTSKDNPRRQRIEAMLQLARERKAKHDAITTEQQ